MIKIFSIGIEIIKLKLIANSLSYRHSFGLTYVQNWILSRSVKTLTFDIKTWSKITDPKKLYVEYSQIELKIFWVHFFF